MTPVTVTEYFGNPVWLELIVLVIALVAVVRWNRPRAVAISLILLAAFDSGSHVSTDASLFAVAPASNVLRFGALHSAVFDPAKALVPRVDAATIDDTASNDAYLDKKFYLASYTPFRLKRLDGLLARGFRPFLLTGQRVVGFVAGPPSDDGKLFQQRAVAVDFQISSYLPGWVEYVVDLPVRTTLVFNEVYFPGWRARVDGRSAGHMAEAAGGLRALTVEAGHHVVVTRFSPAVFWVGLVFTLLSWLLALAWLVRSLLRARKSWGTSIVGAALSIEPGAASSTGTAGM